MNWLDVVLLLVLAVSLMTSFRKGFSREVIGLVTGIAALILGIGLYGTAGAFLLPYVNTPASAHFAGFFVVFFAVLLLGAVVNHIVGRFLKVTGLSFVDHALGAAFGLVRGILVAVALIMGMMAFSPGERPPDAVVESRLAPYVASASRVVVAVAPHELKEGFRKTYGELRTIWDKELEKGIRTGPNTEKGENERKI
jgi:membrane protein required for colicin V production